MTYLNDPALADAILDRVLHAAHKVTLAGESLLVKTYSMTGLCTNLENGDHYTALLLFDKSAGGGIADNLAISPRAWPFEVLLTLTHAASLHRSCFGKNIGHVPQNAQQAIAAYT